MPKLRKMLGDMESGECVSLMRLIETQSKMTLAAWAIRYARDHYLGIYESEYPDDLRMREIISVCEDYIEGNKKLSDINPVIKEAVQIARGVSDNPAGQAAARAVSTACAAVQTPTNSFGFLLYGAAAAAYSQAGLTEPAEVYDSLASAELQKAYESLQSAAVQDEPEPVKIKWNC